MWILLGAALGAAIAWGPLAWLSAPVGAVATALVTTVTSLLGSLFGMLPGDWAHNNRVSVAEGLIAAACPGAVCLGLILAARGTLLLKRVVSGVLVAAALCSFAFQPVHTAVALTLGAVIAGALLSFATGLLLVAPMTAVAVCLGVRVVSDVFSDHGSAMGGQVAHLSAVFGSVDPSLWRIALAVAAIAPVAAAAKAALRN